ncbi:unnamed protein product [Ceratitis capitata]|uniref:(Mediterranean fruit fly) hypothetical protein n=1 Tax=Ceratitis capitata TaxID=7213 RepID=A0A811V2S7_CERCA|nr:unnamed protein product [Ceratitis capitata]
MVLNAYGTKAFSFERQGDREDRGQLLSSSLRLGLVRRRTARHKRTKTITSPHPNQKKGNFNV